MALGVEYFKLQKFLRSDSYNLSLCRNHRTLQLWGKSYSKLFSRLRRRPNFAGASSIRCYVAGNMQGPVMQEVAENEKARLVIASEVSNYLRLGRRNIGVSILAVNSSTYLANHPLESTMFRSLQNRGQTISMRAITCLESQGDLQCDLAPRPYFLLCCTLMILILQDDDIAGLESRIRTVLQGGGPT